MSPVRVHDATANGGTPTHVTLTTGLTDLDVLVRQIADLTDAGLAAVSYTHLDVYKRQGVT